MQLRVSSIISNFAYILVLDCDMYCNDSSSARQAVCFFLDPKISPSLGWVQFPQKFHNISQTDIYDSQYRVTWPVLYACASYLLIFLHPSAVENVVTISFYWLRYIGQGYLDFRALLLLVPMFSSTGRLFMALILMMVSF